ncbi:MAG: HaeII family restriction endonuclease [Coriobacteriia bacterium]|nr:HaeII family restriction endonuclease [Coriobacteriia bacterium]
MQQSPDREIAKDALDNLIRKSRIHLYKPIQIAEILHKVRTQPNSINLSNLEDYRNKSKKWRDDVTRELIGTTCTSSARFQDDLFNSNAIPPTILIELSKENIRTNGAVEGYIYQNFFSRYAQLSEALNYARSASKDDFIVTDFIGRFRREPGLRRSIDKVYEIVVYSLFAALVEALELEVLVSVDEANKDALAEFADFAKIVMSLDMDNLFRIQEAKVYRVGVANAADRGLDMYANWGPAIQIKHVNLDEALVEEIAGSVTSDKIVIVCKDADEKLIMLLLNQLGWQNRIQGIVTEDNLVCWYEKALRGVFSEKLGERLLEYLRDEMVYEFPAADDKPKILENRKYDAVTDQFWSV